MPKCVLQGYGACRGKTSREHFISETVLQQLSLGKTVTIGGLPWQPPSTLQDFSVATLQSRILCEGHNNGLTVLDSTAGKLLHTLDAIDKTTDSVAPLVQFRGPAIERWFLKVLCGLVAGQGLAGKALPDTWKDLLTGGRWPPGWGLYCVASGGPLIFSKDFYIVTKVNPQTGRILACEFSFGGVRFFLLLGKPDVPGAFGIHRPGGLIFEVFGMERRVQLLWPNPTDTAVTFTRVGTTADGPTFLHGWQRDRVAR